jgi:serine/threonine-protein kinase
MGEVWTAENLATGAEVAIKFLLAKQTDAPNGVARFRREAKATAQLAHRCIVRVFDLVELPDASGSIAIVMERLRGRTLAARLRRDGPLPSDEALGHVVPILRALHYAHGMGIIHRDLKPENVFLHIEPDGHLVPKLIDFGLSKVLRNVLPPITIVGEVVGTPSHMSPEQVLGAEVDARSDVFCAGVLLYSCLTGRSPFTRSDAPSTMQCVFSSHPARPPQIPVALWRVIARALEKRPDDRYETAAELADALLVATPGMPSECLPGDTLHPALAPRRPRWWSSLAALAANALVFSTGSSCRPLDGGAGVSPPNR